MTDLWIAPDVCTLPSVEQPLRVAEFDAVFAAYLRQVEHVSHTKLRMNLAGPDDLAAQVQDLANRETACCSFFTFSVRRSRSDQPDLTSVQLDIEVPAAYGYVLAELANHARPAQTDMR